MKFRQNRSHWLLPPTAAFSAHAKLRKSSFVVGKSIPIHHGGNDSIKCYIEQERERIAGQLTRMKMRKKLVQFLNRKTVVKCAATCFSKIWMAERERERDWGMGAKAKVGLRLVHTSRRSLWLSQRARPLQVAAKNWKVFYLATDYCRSQQICSVVWTSL